MRTITYAVVALLAGATALRAQERQTISELRPFAGAYVPAGTQRDFFPAAPIFGLQAGLQLRPTLHVVGSFGMVPLHSKYDVTRDNAIILMYDVGVERGLPRRLRGGWQLAPFIGLGVGARTYSYRARELTTQTCGGAYGALGTELQLGLSALRIEARDNLYRFRSPVAGVKSETRNDLAFTLGFARHFR